MTILVTGAAGFIGFHLARSLLERGETVVGLDGMTDYYDVLLKQRRLSLLAAFPAFTFVEARLEDDDAIRQVFESHRPEVVYHLAAQAGVRHSIEQPRSYIAANIVGTFNLLEACRHHPVRHLMLASTSSAYGANVKYPFEETDPAIHPITLYAATKASTELMAHCYSHLFGTPVTAFRFFTVYGPWGRPDMSYFKFTRNILDGKPIEVFNHGDCWRDFTFIDDLVASILLLSDVVPPAAGPARATSPVIAGDTLSPVAPYRLVNIGGGRPISLTDFIDEIEKALGVRAIRELKPLPSGDVVRTFASAELLVALTGQKPSTPLSTGIPRFVDWYRSHQN
jgi:UDP-glucuronate 4-epimerase